MDRNTLAYWLEVEGIDPESAAKIIKLDRRGIDPRPNFGGSDMRVRIDRAFDGLACVQLDC